MKKLTDMTQAELVRAKKRAGIACSQACDFLIAAGRGTELASETRRKSDPLALRYIEAEDWYAEILAECERRRRYHGSLHRIIERKP